MPRAEETHRGHTIVVDEAEPPTVTVDDAPVQYEVDDHGPRTLYRPAELPYRTYESLVAMARDLVEEGRIP